METNESDPQRTCEFAPLAFCNWRRSHEGMWQLRKQGTRSFVQLRRFVASRVRAGGDVLHLRLVCIEE